MNNKKEVNNNIKCDICNKFKTLFTLGACKLCSKWVCVSCMESVSIINGHICKECATKSIVKIENGAKMKNLIDIIQDAKMNEILTEDEMRYAICLMSALLAADREFLDNIYLKFEQGDGNLDYLLSVMEKRHEYLHTALNSDPKVYLGGNYDPKNPEYVKRIKGVVKKFLGRFEQTLDE